MTGDGISCVHLEDQDQEMTKEVEEVEEVMDAPCPADSCYPGVKCRTVRGGVRCGACPAGLSGDGVECRDIDDCLPNPCYPGVTCSDNKAPRRGYQCGDCPADTEGDGMTCKLRPTSLPLLAPHCTRQCRSDTPVTLQRSEF